MSSNRVPVVGILTSENPRGGFSGNRSNFRDISLAGDRWGARVYVFTPRDVDFAHRRMYGYRWIPRKKRWVRQAVPFPQVVYNRIPSRQAESEPRMQQLLRRLQTDPHVHLFNPQFFNKRDLIHWLRKYPSIQTHLPETLPYASEALQEMAHKYPRLYLKSVHGKAGADMMLLTRTKEGFQLVHQGLGQRRTMTYRTLEEVNQYLLRQRGTYLIQQAIDLATFHGRPYDLRVLVQKDGSGQWRTTGIGARLAGKKAISTHVPQGGRIAHPKQLLEHSFGKAKAEEILSRTRKLSITLAQCVEENQSALGEISADIGVDRHGQLWIFEANAKPMKFDEPAIRQLSLKRLIQYCIYLANAKPIEVEG